MCRLLCTILNMFRDSLNSEGERRDAHRVAKVIEKIERFALGYWPFPNCVIFLASSQSFITALIAVIDAPASVIRILAVSYLRAYSFVCTTSVITSA